MKVTRHQDGAADWRSADDWFTPGRFAAVLGGLIFLTFFSLGFGLAYFQFQLSFTKSKRA